MKRLLCICCMVFLYFGELFYAQQADVSVRLSTPTAEDRAFAVEEFRRGVQAWYRGSFNDAVLQFERALSYLPEEGLILDWLGKAYYRAGMEGTALQQWQLASDLGYGGLLLQNRIEVVENRRITGDSLANEVRFVESTLFSGSTGEIVHFSQPLSVLPLDNGSLWTIAYGSNELLLFDVNGTIDLRVKGPLNGFDRPMDIALQANGNLLVSEYAGDRISQLDSRGNFITYFGSKGRGDGQLLGPQFLAQDSSGNVFVTDYGNARVVVFNAQGEWLFNFGDFISPTGIVIIDDIVYVADNVTGNISMYDIAGNYLDVLIEENTLFQVESLRQWGDYILATDTNKIFTIDIENGNITETVNIGNAPTRLTCADVDQNGNIVASDFQNSNILILSRMTELIGGFFVQVEKLYSDNFPNVTVELRVQNRNRQPIVGLKDINFLLTEEQRPVSQQRLIGSGDSNNFCDITILIDRSIESSGYSQAIDNAVREIAGAMNGTGTLSVVSAGSVPLTEYSGSPTVMERFSSTNLRTSITENPQTDLAIRLASNDLINASAKRAIVYLTADGDNPQAFTNYSLADISGYLNNNGISFSTVNLSLQDISAPIDYITNQTPLGEYYVFRPQGLSGIVQDILAVPVGLYQFSYVSSLPTNFGSLFLPLEVEVYLAERSGRDETGYFAPLQ